MSIRIARWDITYLVAAGDPSAELRDRLDKLVRTDVANSCARLLTEAAGSDPAVWLIRHLDLDLTLGVSHAESAAKQWGEKLATSIQKTIVHGEESGSVLHFPNRPAYLAQFIRDLAAGAAWGKWYYEEFSSLQGFSVSRAIRDALTAQPDCTGPSIVGLIEIKALREVLASLTDADAGAVFETWRNALPSSSSKEWVGRLLQVWSQTPFRDSGREDHPYRDGLWWTALAVSRYGEADQALMDNVQSLLRLRSVLAVLGAEGCEDVIRFLSRDDVDSATALAQRRGASDPYAVLDFFRRNMESDVDWARQALGVLLGEQEYLKKSAITKVFAHGPAIPSPCAGIFRLGPSFRRIGFQQASVRHLVAMKCLGRGRASAGDGALRLFSGFEDSFGEGPVPQVELPVVGAAQGPCWLIDSAELSPGVRAVFLRDVLQDEWVWATLDSPDALELAASWAARLSDRASPVILRRGSSDMDRLADEMPFPKQRFLRGVRPLSEDLAYFSTGLPEIAAELDLSTTLLARAVLRHFSRRLPGFDGSSPEHLYQSFLAGIGFVRDSGERIEIELPQPPLAIVLTMAGILEETYSLQWLEGREICLLRSRE